MLGEDGLYALLEERGIAYDVYEHEAVFDVAAARALDIPHDDGTVACKNLFLRDDKKRAYFLVTAPDDMRVDLRVLQGRLGSRRLSFASAADLASMLGLIPGAVTPFGLLNDSKHMVTFVLDESLATGRIDAHPMVNTATVQLASRDLVALLREAGVQVRLLAVGEVPEP